MVSDSSSRVLLGKLGAPHGVRGWLKVQSYTDPVERIFHYKQWVLSFPGDSQAERSEQIELFRDASVPLLVKLSGINDRDAASLMTHAAIYVDRGALPELSDSEYYWVDLVGCQVVDQAGIVLGPVDHVFSNGVQDVLVIAGADNLMLPFIDSVVLDVDLERRVIQVDWQIQD